MSNRTSWPTHRNKARRHKSFRLWSRRQRRLERRRVLHPIYEPDPAP